MAEIQCVFPFLSIDQDVVSFHDYDERVVVQWAPVSASAKAAPIIADTPELTFGMQLPKEPSAHRAAVAGDVCCGRFHPISNTTLLVQKSSHVKNTSFLLGFLNLSDVGPSLRLVWIESVHIFSTKVTLSQL